jgi:Tol biopolymer transport system component
MRRLILAITLGTASLALVGTAGSRVASSGAEIFSIALDGSDPRRLTSKEALWARAPAGIEEGEFVPPVMEDLPVYPAWSSRGELAFGRWDGSSCGPYGLRRCATAVLMVANPTTGAVREVSRSRSRGAGSFSWAPRGDRITYVGEYDSDGTGSFRTLEIVRADGSGRRVLVRVREKGAGLYAPAWSPRGDWIVFRRYVSRRSDSMWLVRPDGRQARKLVRGHSATWSPTGNRLLYIVDGTLRVLDMSTGRVRQLAKARSISLPSWSPDGRRIAFATSSGIKVLRAVDGRLLYAPAATGVIMSLFFTRDGDRLVYSATPS